MNPTTNGGWNLKPMIRTRLLSSTIRILVMVILHRAQLVIGGDAASPLTKPHCISKCGDLNISYPFGFTDDAEDCFLPNFGLKCNETYHPPKVFSGDFEVLDMSLESGEIRVLISPSYYCYDGSGDRNWSTWDLSLPSLFEFSSMKNIYTVVGCDTVAFIYGSGERNFTGCVSVCGDKYNMPADGSCSGNGCCQTSIPEGLRVYSTGIMSFYNHSGILDFNNCSYSFLVEKNNYTFDKNDLKYMDKERLFPIVWDWSIGNQTCEEAKNSPDYACVSNNSYCLNSTNDGGYLCSCSRGYRGNPYLRDGCQDIDECQEQDTYFCSGTCINFSGSYNCTCPDGTTGDTKSSGCTPKTRNKNTSNTSVLIIVKVLVLSSLGAIALDKFVYPHIKTRKLTMFFVFIFLFIWGPATGFLSFFAQVLVLAPLFH